MRDNVDRVADIFIIVLIAIVIGLKLEGVITISWFWLLSPLWLLFGLGIILSIIFLILCIIESYIINKENKNERY